MATNAERKRPAETYIGVLGSTPRVLEAMIGAQIPAILLRKEAMPVPVPLFGAGSTSGV